MRIIKGNTKDNLDVKGERLIVAADRESDKLVLSVVAKVAEEMAYISELADSRVKAAQQKMHEATTETARIKDGWLFKFSDFISEITTKLKRGKL